MILYGVDPGASGGIAWQIGTREPRAIAMPATEVDTFLAFEQPDSSERPGGHHMIAVIEKVHSRPGEGVSSAFKFGWNYGGLRMAILAAGIRLEEVTPYTWQKALGIPKRKPNESKTQFKNRLKARAQELYPGMKVTLKTCDALLILEYAKKVIR